MVEIAVKHLQSTTGARLVAGDPERVCRGVEIDSRQVGPDSVFVAFPGERVDGNAFAPAALSAGAGAVVLTREQTTPSSPSRSSAAPPSSSRTIRPNSCCVSRRVIEPACGAPSSV